MDTIITTPFRFIYDRFLSKTTDDLYLEMTREETEADLEDILLNSIPGFKFPRFPLFSYSLDVVMSESGETVEGEEPQEPTVLYKGFYSCAITHEEVDILSDLMMIQWLSRQIMSVETIRMKYSGSDFKLTSQANHLDKLLKAKGVYEVANKSKQNLYKRRRVNAESGLVETNYYGLAGGAIKGGD